MLLKEFQGRETVTLDVAAADVFALITEVERLPEWNAHVHHVIASVGGPLAPGVEWVVQIRAMHTKWPSRSRATVVDADHLRFEHISQSDDGNPTYVEWRWQLEPAGRGCTLTVSWTGRPLTFWRRLLLARVRAPQLADEVRASLAGLGSYLHTDRPARR